jgi:hypothetical protein
VVAVGVVHATIEHGLVGCNDAIFAAVVSGRKAELRKTYREFPAARRLSSAAASLIRTHPRLTPGFVGTARSLAGFVEVSVITSRRVGG